MRIDRLAVEGFGPFAARQEVDFRALDEAGLFLITGRTGSGKSSLLDAVCFALYGSAPRYDGGQQRLRSDLAAPDAPTSVELEFTVRDERWRVVRGPEHERPKRRGGGTTRAPATATLERWQDGSWVGVAARPVDVAEHLAPVLQLTREQFLQVILLAQGRFQEFLRARSEDRLGLLRTLFGTDRFAAFEAELTDRAKALEQEAGADRDERLEHAARLAAAAGVEAPADPDATWAAAVAADLDALLDGARIEEGEAVAAFTSADSAAASARDLASRQQRRAAARELLARAEAASTASVDEVRRLARAEAAAPLEPLVEEAARTADAAARSTLAAARAGSAVGEDVRDPEEAAAEAERLIGSLAAALEDERRLPALVGARDAAVRAATGAAVELKDAAEAAAAVPLRIAEGQREREVLALEAAGGAAAGERLATARRTAAAVASADAASAAVPGLQAALLTALHDERSAVEHVRQLLAARLGDAAGALAADLVDGAPCAVCGATAHPSPAVREGGPVPSDADLAAAERHRAAAAARRDAAGRALERCTADRDAALDAASGSDAARATAAVEAALAASRAAGAAAERLAAVDRRLEALRDAGAEAEHAVALHRDRLAVLEGDRARADQELAATSARTVAARGPAADVAERVRLADAHRRLLVALAAAVRQEHADTTAAHEADERLAGALVESDFADAGAVLEAALPAAERRLVRERLAAIDRDRAAAALQLADPDLAAAPEEPADVDGTAAAKTAALIARDAAAERRSAAEHRSADATRALRAFESASTRAAAVRERLDLVGPLAAVVRGEGGNDRRMRLESYVLAARLEQIVAAANLRLAVMSDGRFTLQHDDGPAYRGARSGLGLEVLDEHTGRPRPIASLSGGETFLASLALALGLAEVVAAEAGGVRLDTLFIDEGFGSLDRQTLDTAMTTLDSLRAGGRTVGLISHVEAMQEDVPAGLHVERGPDGASTVRSRTPVPA